MPAAAPLAPTDELIDLVYNGPLEAVPWQGFLKALARRMNCRSAALVLRLSRQGRSPMVIWGDPPSLDEEEARRIRAVHAELGHLDPLRNALAKPGDLHTLDEITTPEELHASDFYTKVYKPYGIEHAIGMYVSEPGGWEGNLGLINDSALDAGDKAMLGDLRPHVERSLALFARLRRDESELQVLTETLDRLTIATIILDETGRVLRSNGAADRLVADGAVLRVSERRLRLTRRGDDAAFQALLDRAIAARKADRNGGFVDAMRVESGNPLGILVRTVAGNAPYAGDAGPALAVYVSGSSESRPVERLVMQLFDLTSSEAQLTTLLASGLTLAEAATQLGLTENTVRTYSKTILSKTGVGRQADLIRLVLRSVAVLG